MTSTSEIELALRIFDQTPHFVWWKNLDLQYVLMNRQTASICGYQSSKVSFEGITDYDLPVRAVEMADDFSKQDRLTIRSKQRITLFTLGHYGKDNWRMVLAHKFPRYDVEGAVVGMSGTGIDVTDCPVMRTALMLVTNDNTSLGVGFSGTQQFTYMIKNTYEDFKLTQRESECLFLLMRGKTNKEIANMMKITSRTIEKHVDRLKLKMQCLRRSELVDKALQSGAGNIIPKSLLSYSNPAYPISNITDHLEEGR